MQLKIIEKRWKSLRKKKNKNNKSILFITIFFMGVFLALIAFNLYYVMVLSSNVINNPYNKRQEVFEKKVIRGSIISSDGSILAVTNRTEDRDYRYYPYGNMFSHIVGYNIKGGYGLESVAGYYMLASNQNAISQLVNDFSDKKSNGDNVIVTLDANLQKIAYDALGNYKGAVIISEPSTGKILAMVSKPDFEPNTLTAEWDNYVNESGNSVLVNRALQGLYTPGSTFKIITLLEYYREHTGDYKNYRYNCEGSVKVGDVVISCNNKEAHNEEDLLKSFANSCNCSFINIGLGLDIKKYNELTQALLFNSKLPINLQYNQSSFSLPEGSSNFNIAQTVFGQGETLMTPLHMSMIINSIANDGLMMKPKILERIESIDGNVVKNFENEEISNVILPEEAHFLQEYLKETVGIRYYWIFDNDKYTLAGKTGTAQLAKFGLTNSLFLSYAPADKPEISVVVVLEDNNEDNAPAAFVAKKIYDQYFCD